jgi:hypothetical protein
MEFDGCNIDSLEIVEDDKIILKIEDIIICKPKKVYKKWIKIMYRSEYMATCRLFRQYENEDQIFFMNEFYTKIQRDENGNEYIIHSKTTLRQLREDYDTFNYIQDE